MTHSLETPKAASTTTSPRARRRNAPARYVDGMNPNVFASAKVGGSVFEVLVGGGGAPPPPPPGTTTRKREKKEGHKKKKKKEEG